MEPCPPSPWALMGSVLSKSAYLSLQSSPQSRATSGTEPPFGGATVPTPLRLSGATWPWSSHRGPSRVIATCEGGTASVGKTTHPSGAGSPLLKTAAGATLGMTLSDVQTLYPAVDFSSSQGGAIVMQGSHDGDRLFLGFFASDPSATLSEIKGGSPCGDF